MACRAAVVRARLAAVLADSINADNGSDARKAPSAGGAVSAASSEDVNIADALVAIPPPPPHVTPEQIEQAVRTPPTSTLPVLINKKPLQPLTIFLQLV